MVSGRRAGGPFLSTKADTVHVHQEGHQGRGRQVPLARTSRPIIQSATAEFPTLLAAWREMQGWRTLMLEPSAMRAPSEHGGPQLIDERGGHLAGTLERLRRHSEGRALAQIANRLAELLPEVREVRVVDDPRFQTCTVEVRGPDGVFHPARALSDGTLRFLVLSALLEDPEARGTVFLEEPENGIHPDRIPAMVRLLHDFAADPTHRVDAENPLRQVVVNSHSPLVLASVDDDEIVFIDSIDDVQGDSRSRVARAAVPEGSWRARGSSGLARVRPARLQQWRQTKFDFETAAAE